MLLVATYGITGKFHLRTRRGRQRDLQNTLQNTLQRLGGNVNKHGQLLRGPCDRCLSIFIFRVPLENSPCTVSDIATRDLISSYFRFSWRVDPHGLSCFCPNPSPPPPTSDCPSGCTPPGGGERYPEAYCATDGGAAIQVLANRERISDDSILKRCLR
jgi:hypothetical protein